MDKKGYTMWKEPLLIRIGNTPSKQPVSNDSEFRRWDECDSDEETVPHYPQKSPCKRHVSLDRKVYCPKLGGEEENHLKKGLDDSFKGHSPRKLYERFSDQFVSSSGYTSAEIEVMKQIERKVQEERQKQIERKVQEERQKQIETKVQKLIETKVQKQIETKVQKERQEQIERRVQEERQNPLRKRHLHQQEDECPVKRVRYPCSSQINTSDTWDQENLRYCDVRKTRTTKEQVTSQQNMLPCQDNNQVCWPSGRPATDCRDYNLSHKAINEQQYFYESTINTSYTNYAFSHNAINEQQCFYGSTFTTACSERRQHDHVMSGHGNPGGWSNIDHDTPPHSSTLSTQSGVQAARGLNLLKRSVQDPDEGGQFHSKSVSKHDLGRQPMPVLIDQREAESAQPKGCFRTDTRWKDGLLSVKAQTERWERGTADEGDRSRKVVVIKSKSVVINSQDKGTNHGVDAQRAQMPLNTESSLNPIKRVNNKSQNSSTCDIPEQNNEMCRALNKPACKHTAQSKDMCKSSMQNKVAVNDNKGHGVQSIHAIINKRFGARNKLTFDSKYGIHNKVAVNNKKYVAQCQKKNADSNELQNNVCHNMPQKKAIFKSYAKNGDKIEIPGQKRYMDHDRVSNDVQNQGKVSTSSLNLNEDVEKKNQQKKRKMPKALKCIVYDIGELESFGLGADSPCKLSHDGTSSNSLKKDTYPVATKSSSTQLLALNKLKKDTDPVTTKSSFIPRNNLKEFKLTVDVNEGHDKKQLKKNTDKPHYIPNKAQKMSRLKEAVSVGVDPVYVNLRGKQMQSSWVTRGETKNIHGADKQEKKTKLGNLSVNYLNQGTSVNKKADPFFAYKSNSEIVPPQPMSDMQEKETKQEKLFISNPLNPTKAELNNIKAKIRRQKKKLKYLRLHEHEDKMSNLQTKEAKQGNLFVSSQTPEISLKKKEETVLHLADRNSTKIVQLKQNKAESNKIKSKNRRKRKKLKLQSSKEIEAKTSEIVGYYVQREIRDIVTKTYKDSEKSEFALSIPVHQNTTSVLNDTVKGEKRKKNGQLGDEQQHDKGLTDTACGVGTERNSKKRFRESDSEGNGNQTNTNSEIQLKLTGKSNKAISSTNDKTLSLSKDGNQCNIQECLRDIVITEIGDTTENRCKKSQNILDGQTTAAADQTDRKRRKTTHDVKVNLSNNIALDTGTKVDTAIKPCIVYVCPCGMLNTDYDLVFDHLMEHDCVGSVDVVDVTQDSRSFRSKQQSGDLVMAKSDNEGEGCITPNSEPTSETLTHKHVTKGGQTDVKTTPETFTRNSVTKGGQTDVKTTPKTLTHNSITKGGQTDVKTTPETLTQKSVTKGGQTDVKTTPETLTHKRVTKGGQTDVKTTPEILTHNSITKGGQTDVKTTPETLTHNSITKGGQTDVKTTPETLTQKSGTKGGQTDVKTTPETLTPKRVTKGGQEDIKTTPETLTHTIVTKGSQAKVKTTPGTLTQKSGTKGGQTDVKTTPETLTHKSATKGDKAEVKTTPGTLTHISVTKQGQTDVNTSPETLTHESVKNGGKAEVKTTPKPVTHKSVTKGGKAEVKTTPETLTHKRVTKGGRAEVKTTPKPVTHKSVTKGGQRYVKTTSETLTHKSVTKGGQTEVKTTPKAVTQKSVTKGGQPDVKTTPETLTHKSVTKGGQTEVKETPKTVTQKSVTKGGQTDVETTPNPVTHKSVTKGGQTDVKTTPKPGTHKSVTNCGQTDVKTTPETLTHTGVTKGGQTEVKITPKPLTHKSIAKRNQTDVKATPETLTHKSVTERGQAQNKAVDRNIREVKKNKKDSLSDTAASKENVSSVKHGNFQGPKKSLLSDQRKASNMTKGRATRCEIVIEIDGQTDKSAGSYDTHKICRKTRHGKEITSDKPGFKTEKIGYGEEGNKRHNDSFKTPATVQTPTVNCKVADTHDEVEPMNQQDISKLTNRRLLYTTTKQPAPVVNVTAKRLKTVEIKFLNRLGPKNSDYGRYTREDCTGTGRKDTMTVFRNRADNEIILNPMSPKKAQKASVEKRRIVNTCTQQTISRETRDQVLSKPLSQQRQTSSYRNTLKFSERDANIIPTSYGQVIEQKTMPNSNGGVLDSANRDTSMMVTTFNGQQVWVNGHSCPVKGCHGALETFSNYTAFDNHWKFYHIPEAIYLECSICKMGDWCQRKYNMKTHIANEHGGCGELVRKVACNKFFIDPGNTDKYLVFKEWMKQ